ncbi:MAG: response regulator [Oligoflexia bacterium]|nr:response regulator [Oligoflexia bacterium]
MPKALINVKKKNIVIIDDSEAVRDSLKYYFESHGAVVYTASQIERVRTLLLGLITENTLPDLVIVDIILPECFGLSALRVINDITRDFHIPILVVSSGFNKLAIAQMKLHDVVAYIEKPVLLEKLYKFTLDLLSDLENANPKTSTNNIQNNLKAVS